MAHEVIWSHLYFGWDKWDILILYSDDDGEDLDLVCDENPDYLCKQGTPITGRGRLPAGDCTAKLNNIMYTSLYIHQQTCPVLCCHYWLSQELTEDVPILLSLTCSNSIGRKKDHIPKSYKWVMAQRLTKKWNLYWLLSSVLSFVTVENNDQKKSPVSEAIVMSW